MTQIIVHCITYTILITAIIILNSLTEWLIHGPLMHGKWGTQFLNLTHQIHHYNFGTPTYKTNAHGPDVHLPLWVSMLMIGFVPVVGGIVSYWSSHWEVLICVAGTSFLYYWAYQYVHTSLHVPKIGKDGKVKPRWYEKIDWLARWFAETDRYHHIHHAYDAVFDKPVNLCILCRVGDFIMGTRFRPEKVASSEAVLAVSRIHQDQ